MYPNMYSLYLSESVAPHDRLIDTAVIVIFITNRFRSCPQVGITGSAIDDVTPKNKVESIAILAPFLQYL